MSGEGVIAKLEKTDFMKVFVQFIKFGLVGVSNTLISYGIEMLFFYVILINVSIAENIKVIITSVAAFIISVTNSYFWNNRFVFKDGQKTLKEHAVRYARTVVAYGVTSLLLSPALKMLLVGINIPYWLASLASLIVTIPLNFLLNKFWAFRKKADGTK